MQCTRCGRKDMWIMRTTACGRMICQDCHSENDHSALRAGAVRSCSQCDNADSQWYARQPDGSDLCLFCKQRQDAANSMAWLDALHRQFGAPCIVSLVAKAHEEAA